MSGSLFKMILEVGMIWSLHHKLFRFVKIHADTNKLTVSNPVEKHYPVHKMKINCASALDYHLLQVRER